MPFYPKVGGSNGGGGGGGTTWHKYTVTFEDVAEANTQVSVAILAVPANQVLIGAVMGLDETFSGGAISAVTLGLATQFDIDAYGEYASLLGYEDVSGTVFATVGDTASSVTVEPFLIGDDIVVTLRSTDDDLDQLTQGQVSIWLGFNTLGA